MSDQIRISERFARLSVDGKILNAYNAEERDFILHGIQQLESENARLADELRVAKLEIARITESLDRSIKYMVAYEAMIKDLIIKFDRLEGI